MSLTSNHRPSAGSHGLSSSGSLLSTACCRSRAIIEIAVIHGLGLVLIVRLTPRTLEYPVCARQADAAEVNRRDFILPNYAQDGFWQFLRSHYSADYIVADAKNYSDPIGKNQILQLANYLTRHGTGLFGIIMTRQGIDRAALHTCRDQWILHTKMVVCLNDEDTLQLLTTSAIGGDPSTLIRQKIEDFRLEL